MLIFDRVRMGQLIGSLSELDIISILEGGTVSAGASQEDDKQR